MSLNIQIVSRRGEMDEERRQRIHKQLDSLGKRLAHFPEPIARLVLEEHDEQRRVTADLSVQLGPLGGHLVSHQAAESMDRAVHLAADDVIRQLERRLAMQSGEPTFGVPSRRLPKAMRPHPPTSTEPEETE